MVEMKRTFTTFPWVRKMGVGGKNPLLYKENKSLDSSWPCHFLPVISGTCSASTRTLFHHLGKRVTVGLSTGGWEELTEHTQEMPDRWGTHFNWQRKLNGKGACTGSGSMGLPSLCVGEGTPLLPLSHPTPFPSRPQKMCSQQDVSTTGCSLEM